MSQHSRLVYSTATGRIKPKKTKPPASSFQQEDIVRIRRETKGRRGKGVTTILGLPLQDAELRALVKDLKQRCGAGGSIKGGAIEIQGDHRTLIKAELEERGYRVRLAGG